MSLTRETWCTEGYADGSVEYVGNYGRSKLGSLRPVKAFVGNVAQSKSSFVKDLLNACPPEDAPVQSEAKPSESHQYTTPTFERVIPSAAKLPKSPAPLFADAPRRLYRLVIHP